MCLSLCHRCLPFLIAHFILNGQLRPWDSALWPLFLLIQPSFSASTGSDLERALIFSLRGTCSLCQISPVALFHKLYPSWQEDWAGVKTESGIGVHKQTLRAKHTRAKKSCNTGSKIKYRARVQPRVRGQKTGCLASKTAIPLLKLFILDHLQGKWLALRDQRRLTNTTYSRDESGCKEFELPFHILAMFSGKYT